MHDKVAIAFAVSMEFLHDLEKKDHISGKYKGLMFSRIFFNLQRNFFPTTNPKEVTMIIEEMDALRTQMKNMITEFILKDAEWVRGGFGVDKPLGTADNALEDVEATVSDSGRYNITEILSSIIEFYKNDIPKMRLEDALRLLTNTAMKAQGVKQEPREKIEGILKKKLRDMGLS